MREIPHRHGMTQWFDETEQRWLEIPAEERCARCVQLEAIAAGREVNIPEAASFKQDLADKGVSGSGGRWWHGWCTCQLCGHREMGVWPDEANNKALECSKCGAMASMPEPPRKPPR